MIPQELLDKYFIPNDENSVMNLDVFDDYTVVTGATGSGKSKLVEDEIVPKYEGVPLWILDVKRKFSNCGIVVHTLEELNTSKQYVYQPKDTSKEMFGKFCMKLQSQENLHAIIDEIHLWLSKQSIFKPHYDLVNTKRNDGVTHTSISTNTKAIPNYLLGNITHIYSLRYNIRGDIDWLSEFIGTKAEFLLTPDLRNPIDTGFYSEELKRNYTFKDMPQLNDYGFIYRDKRKLDASIMRGFKI